MTSKDPFSLRNFDGIDNRIKDSLTEEEIYSVKDLVVRGAMNVSEATGISIDKCNRICSKARSRLEQLGIMNRPFTANTYKEIKKISLGSKSLDLLLGGKGVHAGVITEFFGQSNSGKTQICHTLCVMVQLSKHEGGLDGKALFIDTESTFTTERLASIAEARGLDKNEALKNVIPARTMSTSEQEHYLETIGTIIDKHKNIRLLIVDSVTSLYRAEFIGRAALPERQQRLHRHMQMLQRFSEVYEVAVVVSNQVNEAPNPFAGSLIRNKPIGGNIMAHDSMYRVGLRQFGDRRIAELIHSPHLPENHIYFKVSEKGVLDMANFC